MNIKALVFDLDGTAIPNSLDAMPSKAVIDAVAEAKGKCHVSVATGRPLSYCEKILDALGIDDLCILNGGTHLYSRKDKAYVWKQEIDSQTLTAVYRKLKVSRDYMVADEKRLLQVPMSAYRTDEPIGLSCIFAVSKEDADTIVACIQSFDTLAVHIVKSWTPGYFDLHITHKDATKKQALSRLLVLLGIPGADVMVVGDGGNDLPLFELAGLRVAMENGAEILKREADWIAPPVDRDGLAAAIRKYITKAA